MDSAFSILIPTRNRHDDLCDCLRSIAAQSCLPTELLIIDASPEPRGDVAQTYQDCAGKVLVRYVRATVPGSSRQRNIAIYLVCQTSQFLIFLDDDTILEPTCCEELLRPMADSPGVVATMGNILNSQGYSYNTLIQAFYRLFLMEGRSGTLLTSGSIGHIRENLHGAPFQTSWLVGCVMAVRRAAMGDLRFDSTFERFGGYAFNEDLDFSYALAKRGPMLCVPDARLVHNMSPAGRPKIDYRFGISQVSNRALFVRKHLPGPVHFACYLWSMLGTMLINAAMIAQGRSPTRLVGNLIGLALVLSGQIRPAPREDG